ncbi:helix-turn-helix domain-containing protein [Streptomyces goshikiensis]|uniref:XRE family transcriptional regulator n=1 Tax=Streptomyces goshikiensis TaxID=1942 RepID=UPI0036665DA0
MVMTTSVRQWTGSEATILRTALRMSIRDFARHLGVSPSMVTEWKSRGRTIVPVLLTQQILDTKLKQCSPEERAAFFAELEIVNAAAPAGVPSQAGLPAGMVRQGLADDVEASQARWREERDYLNSHREVLSQAAASLYPPSSRIAGTPMLTSKAWMPEIPVSLDRVKLTWADEVPEPLVTGTEPEAAGIHPLRAPGVRFDRYTLAIRYINSPTLFENRPSYRLQSVDWAGGGGELTFGLASYFDKLDVCEAIGHEFAAAHMAQEAGSEASLWGALPLRRMLDNPFDFGLRAVTPAITTLLLRRRPDGSATFLLHWRDPAKVATAGGLYDAIPAGEFQPGSVLSAQSPQDFDLWRNIVRELNEELLGAPEFDGSGSPLRYERWPLWRALERARGEGRVRVYAFGIGVDALTMAAAIPSALVIDDEVFDQLFGDIAADNAEGITVTQWRGQDTRAGIPFTQENVEQFIHNEPMAPPGAACLALAWQHRELLLGR